MAGGCLSTDLSPRFPSDLFAFIGVIAFVASVKETFFTVFIFIRELMMDSF